ncbi:unnamed protein product [Timema podura]|uniref:Uncharacterized protein n=1 Tax=Timema podura TaxID=61482 RepID=A0ABN7PH03_TIMPD|nr:unnamed protein product [Timema podura]
MLAHWRPDYVMCVFAERLRVLKFTVEAALELGPGQDSTRPVTGTGPTGPIPENFPRSRLHYPYARCLDKLESTYTRGTPKNHVRTSEPGHQEEDSTYNQPAPTRTAVKSPTIKNTINSSEVHHHPNSASLLFRTTHNPASPHANWSLATEKEISLSPGYSTRIAELLVPPAIPSLLDVFPDSVEPWFLEHFSPADEPDKDGLYSRALGLRFQLDKRHFNNPLELKCSATVGGRTWDRVVSPGLATLTNQKLAQESLRRGPDVGHLLPGNCVTARCPEVLTLTSISTTATDKQLQQNIIKRVHSIRQSPHFTGKYSKHGRGNWYRFQNTVKVTRIGHQTFQGHRCNLREFHISPDIDLVRCNLREFHISPDIDLVR